MKAVEVYRAWQQRYPNDFTTYNNLAGLLLGHGRDEEALQQAQQAVALNPEAAFPYANLSAAYVRLRPLDAARQVIDDALRRGLVAVPLYEDLATIGTIERDQRTLARGLQWLQANRPHLAQRYRFSALAGSGRLRDAAAFARPDLFNAYLAIGNQPGGLVELGLAAVMCRRR